MFLATKSILFWKLMTEYSKVEGKIGINIVFTNTSFWSNLKVINKTQKSLDHSKILDYTKDIIHHKLFKKNIYYHAP